MTAMADPNVVVLDARTAIRYQMRHIKGAINLPLYGICGRAIDRRDPEQGHEDPHLL